MIHEALHCVLGPEELRLEGGLLVAEHWILKCKAHGDLGDKLRERFTDYDLAWRDQHRGFHPGPEWTAEFEASKAWRRLVARAVRTGTCLEDGTLVRRNPHPDWSNFKPYLRFLYSNKRPQP
jgi:hypothetical protein